MCGIAGIIRPPGRSISRHELMTLQGSLKERGPDSRGIWLHESCGFVHTRLSVMDTSTRANQPMVHEGVALVYNGEIYNFQQLRQELQRYNSHFETTSDTEVLLLGYLQWGIDRLLDKLEGMFAFAIYDPRVQKIFLARDRFGEKPLYLFTSNDEIIFSSDIRGIWKLRNKSLDLDLESLDYYFTELTVPQPKSIWQQIRQVRPAHYLEINIPYTKATEVSYWTLPSEQKSIQDNEALEQVEAALVKSVMSRRISDVSLGCFLSSGVDSGLLVALLASKTAEKVKTFTVGFADSPISELQEARIVAERYGTDHHEILIEPHVVEDVEDLLSYYGEPFADSSCIPTYYVTKAIGNHVKVGISGDGGDEMFGGYEDYLRAYRTDQYLRKYGTGVKSRLLTFGDKVLSRLGSRENLGSLRAFSRSSGSARLYRHMGFVEEEKSRLFQPHLAHQVQGFAQSYLDEMWDSHFDNSFGNTIMRASLSTRLLNDYLVKVDRASMMNSVEVRAPFLSKELAELAFAIPNSVKFKDGNNKYLLKKLAQKHVNSKVFEMPKKGFAIPLANWLRTDLREWVCDYLTRDSRIAEGICNYSEMSKYLTRFFDGDDSLNFRVWSMVCLEVWLRNFD